MDELDHMRSAIEALVQAGNPTTNDGLRSTQGGPVCGFLHRLDAAVCESLIADDPRLRYDAEADEMFCPHCWCVLFGAVASERYQAPYRSATDQPW